VAEDGFELSRQQELLWLTEPDGPQSRVQCCARLPDGAVAADVSRALQQSVSRHEVLRTHFARPTGMRIPVQVIAQDLPAHWTTARASTGQPPAEDLAAAEWAEPFDLATGPLVRGLLVDGPGDCRELILTASAVVADAETLLRVATEVNAHLAGEPLAGEPLQYADYAAWQREQQHPAAPADADPAAIGLPFLPADRRPASQQAVLRLAVDPLAVTALRDLAAQRQLPVQDTWLAVWMLLAARLSGHPELAMSVAVDGRGLEELADAAGPYEMAATISCPPSWEEPFSHFLGRVATVRAAATGPGIHALPPDPLPFGFGWRQLPADVRALRGTQVSAQVQLDVSSAGFAELRYDAASVSPQEAHRVAAHLDRLLRAVVSAPTASVGTIEILPVAERERLLAGPPTPAVTAPPVTTLIERQVAHSPSAPAVVAADATLSYAELEARANALAHLLRDRGVGPDTPVAILLERTSQLIVAVLGILKAGGAYLPLNPEHPSARLAYQLTDASPAVLLTQQSLLSAVPETRVDVVCLDCDLLDRYPSSHPPVEPAPADLAYLIYTSGSTGTPKGVAIRHGSLTNYTTALVRSLALDADPLHFALVTTMSTDLGNTAVFPALASGGCLHLVPVDVAMDGEAYAEHSAREPVDVLKITPSHLTALLAAGGPRVLPRRHLIVGGEAFPWALADQVTSLAGCAVTNHYGPTETTVGSLTYDVRSADETVRGMTRTVPIGRPVAGTTAYVVDATGGLAPAGVVGELQLGGAGLARGYWDAPELTAERFRADTFLDLPGGRVYRTGDQVRRLHDDSLEFVGRDDDQVKIRGFRVELGEIESVLKQQPQVRAAAAVARPDADGNPRIVAYVVGGLTTAADLEALRAELSARLPAYMVPAAVVPMERLPLGPAGKLDKGALPDPDTARSAAFAVAVPPRTDVERRLVKIWGDVLALETVGVTDDFFGLGGHSLLATQVLARIRNEFDVQLPLPSIFLAPTIEELALLVEERLPPSGDDDLAQILEQVEDLTEEEAERLLRLESDRPE